MCENFHWRAETDRQTDSQPDRQTHTYTQLIYPKYNQNEIYAKIKKKKKSIPFHQFWTYTEEFLFASECLETKAAEKL